MKKSLILLILLSGCSSQTIAPSTSSSPAPVVDTAKVEDGRKLVVLSTVGAGVDKAFAEKAIGYLNRVYASDCLKYGVLNYPFKSLHSVSNNDPKSNLEAYERYVKNAPYALDLKWYSKRLSSTIGYTYNYKNGAAQGDSETAIFSNTKYIYHEKDYAAHLAHELSHQARAGGFVHYTVHQGSYPYAIGDIAAACLSAIKD